jgi:hypothetical protein
MTTIITINGSMGLYISPGSEIEKLVLGELAKGPVEIRMHSTITVGDKVLNDCIQIIPSVAKLITI